MKCPICHTYEASHHILYGYLPCLQCQERQAHLPRAGDQVEFVPERIREDRKAGFDDIHPAHRKGNASKEFKDKWGAAAMKRQGFSDKQIKNAKNVWNDDRY